MEASAHRCQKEDGEGKREPRGGVAAASQGRCILDGSPSPNPQPCLLSAAAAADGAARLVSRGAPQLTAAGWSHLLAMAESWSRIRPSPSNIVSSVSLLSSMVTAETKGLSPHRLGSSWT